MIVIFGASHPLGQATALGFADAGARVVLVDSDAAALHTLCDQNPGWIEAVAVEDMETQMRGLLKDAWSDEQIAMVINMLPLMERDDISAQMRLLTAVTQTTLRGLVKGQGVLVNLCARAADPLGFVAHGMGAAVTEASTALAQVMADKGVRVHSITLPDDACGPVVETLKHLNTPAGRRLRSTCLNLERAAQ